VALNYWDTSALIPYYLPEEWSDRIQALLLGGEAAISPLVEVEFFSVLARRVRAEELSRRDARRVAERFLGHVKEGAYRYLPLEVIHYKVASQWLRRFDLPLRAPDALHLAVASQGGIPIVTLDRQMARAAEALGVEVRLLG